MSVDELLDHLRRNPGGTPPALQQVQDRARRWRRRRAARAVLGVLAILTIGAAVLGPFDSPWVELVPADGRGTLEIRDEPEDGRMPEPAPQWTVGSWRMLPDSPVVGRGATRAWTGSELLLWGGVRVAPSGAEGPEGEWELDEPPQWELFDDGAAFDPQTDTWRPLPPAPLSARFNSSMTPGTWTGEELIIWGGVDAQGPTSDGAAYDPRADRWRPLAPAPLSPRAGALMAWTGEEVLVWGGSDQDGPFSGGYGLPLTDGAAYDPQADRWRPLPEAPRAATVGMRGVWDGRELLVFPRRNLTGMAYNPATDTWREIVDPPLSVGYSTPPIWAGDRLVLPNESPSLAGSFALMYDPVADAWQASGPAPEWFAREYRPLENRWATGPAVWIGDALAVLPLPPGIVAGFQGSVGGLWRPDGDIWEAMTPPPRLPLLPSVAVWTGEEILVFGLAEASLEGSTGGLAWRP